MRLGITIVFLIISSFCVACSSIASNEIFCSESGAKIPINQWRSE